MHRQQHPVPTSSSAKTAKAENLVLLHDKILEQASNDETSLDDAQVADDLVETLTSMDGAACLAANQIGATTCIIAYLDDDDQPHVMYNPRLLQALGAFKAVEGCLSLEADSKVTRFDRIKVGYSELVDGELKPRKKDFNGWTAQIIQHGIDHCKGKLV